MNYSSKYPLMWQRLRFALPLDVAAATGLLERIVVDASLGRLILEARATSGRVRYLLGATNLRHLGIVRELLPGTRVVATAIERKSVTQSLRLSVRRAGLPLSVERLESVARAVLAAMAATEDEEELVVQLHIGSRYQPTLNSKPQPEGWLELLGITSTSAASREHQRRARSHAGKHRSGVCLRLGVKAVTPARCRLLLQGLLGGLRVAESAGVRLHARPDNPSKLNQARRPWHYPLTLDATEVLCLSGWPIGQARLPAMPNAHPRSLPLPEQRDRQRVFARGLGDQADQRLGISIRDALLHTVLLGPTGAGKSTVLGRLALNDIDAGRGVLLIDPKTDLVNDLLARIPEQRTGDVVVIDPTSPTPIGLNPLATSPRSREQVPEVIADTVLATFKNLFADAWGVRTEEILTASLLTLARTPGATLVDLPLLLTNPAFRCRIIANAPDPLGTGQFWSKYQSLSEAQRLQWIAPVLNKLQPFLIRPHLRATLGQTNPSFDLADLLTKHRIVLVSLNKGILGSESARLLGSLIVGQLWPLILSRAALPPERRHIISVFIDEVQDYLALPTDLADALTQSRSLGVAFHLVHQYRAQLPSRLKAAIDTNAHNKIIFGSSAADASEIARLAPELEATDFQLLPRYSIYARTIHHGHINPWCQARTLPMSPATGDPASLRAASAARYGQEARQVEEQLLKRLGLTSTPTTTTDTTVPTGTNDSTPAIRTTASSNTTGSVTIGRRPKTKRGTESR